MNLTALSLTFAGLFAIIFARYLFVVWLFEQLVCRRPHKFQSRRLNRAEPKPHLRRSDQIWSAVSCLIFAVPGALMIEAWKLGWTNLYEDPSKYGWAYLVFSLPLILFLHDTYFYWTHRLLHWRPVYRLVHFRHHQSVDLNPWAAMSFHPAEAVIEAIFLPLLVLIMPIHLGVFVTVLTLMTVLGIVNHLGYEIYPRFLYSGRVGTALISATHHSLHHQRFNCNYGLYFRLWDHACKTDVQRGT